MTLIYYVIVPVGQKFRDGLVGLSCLGSQRVHARLAGTAVSSEVKVFSPVSCGHQQNSLLAAA